MKRLAVAVVAFVLLGSVARASERRAPMVPLTDDQIRALVDLSEIRLASFDANGVPTFLAGRLGHLGPGQLDAAALRYLQRLNPLLRATGREEFAPARVQSDDLGQVHVRFQQYFRGLPVVGAELVVHASAATGAVHAINGQFIPDVGLARQPRIDASEAMIQAVIETGIEDAQIVEAPALVYVVTENAKAYLAWSFFVAYANDEGEQLDRLFADAVTGDLVARHGLFHRALNRRIYNGNHTNPDYPTLPGTFMFGEGATSNSDAAAWACYVNFGYTYNYYAARFNRDSFDGSGAALIGTVHVGTNWVNAYWNGSQMVFGDGDGSTASYLSGALDVVAHELTHAVTDRTANLTYQNESGALNEAMSDILAAGVEVYKDGSVTSDTWKVGEDVWTPATPGDALRYMNNPTADGQSYDYYPERYTGTQDYGGVHLNSGIANLAFYLVVQGGTHPRGKTSVTVPAIGMTKAEQIFYRALTFYMTSSTNFEGARNATAQSAQDLYGQTEVDAVQACWNAVGVPGGPVSVSTLSNGQTVSNLSGTTGSFDYYKISVPAGQTSLEIKIWGGSGDADLYVKRGALPTTSSYDLRPYLSGNTETVTVSSPASGDWYIGIRAYSSYSGLSLQTTYVGASPTLSLTVAPTAVSVTQGGTGTATATTTVGGSFNSPVSLSASGLPSGASASFSPSSIPAPGAGSSSITFNGGTATAGTYNVTITASGGGLSSTAAVSLTITASGGGVIVLNNGQTVSSLSGSSGTWAYYKIAVPAGQSSLVIQTSGGSGDCDLYVKRGSQPSSSSYDYRPYLSGNNETVTVTNPASGDWYVGLYGYSSYSGMSLNATYAGSSGGGVTDISNGQTVSGLSDSTGNWKYYRISVPSGQSQLEVKTTGGSGDLDLYLKLGASPTSSSNDGKSESSSSTETVTISNPAGGDWYIGLYAYAAYSSVSLTATYSGSSGGGSMNESENNGSRSTADVIPASGTVVTGYIGSSSDSDYFKITLPGTATLNVDVVVPSNKDYDVRLYNSSGTMLASSTNNTGQPEHITYTNTSSSSRVVYVRVYGYNGAYSTGSPYTLTATW